jgi:hypothetical protein
MTDIVILSHSQDRAAAEALAQAFEARGLSVFWQGSGETWQKPAEAAAAIVALWSAAAAQDEAIRFYAGFARARGILFAASLDGTPAPSGLSDAPVGPYDAASLVAIVTRQARAERTRRLARDDPFEDDQFPAALRGQTSAPPPDSIPPPAFDPGDQAAPGTSLPPLIGGFGGGAAPAPSRASGGRPQPVPRGPAAAPAPSAGPAPLSKVALSAFAPETVRPGARVLVQAFLHAPMQAEAVRKMAAERDRNAGKRGALMLNQLVAQGAKVTVSLDADGLEAKETAHSFTWLGDPLDAAFEVRIPSWRRRPEYLLKLMVTVDGAPVGRLVFRLEVDPKAERRAESRPRGAYRPYEYVFCSYSGEDRAAVEARARVLAALEVPYFLDVQSLRAGEDWEAKLKEHLSRADLFLLFWSPAAAKSKWVAQEALWALDLQERSPEARPDIKPYQVDPKKSVKPPKALAHLHFEKA